MPNRTQWHLHYPAGTIDDLHVLRRHYEALRQDPRVVEVHITLPFGSPMIREMVVVFGEGWSNPLIPELHFLNQRYPRRDLTTLMQRVLGPPHVSPMDARRVVDALHSGPSDMFTPSDAFDFIFTDVGPTPSLDPVRLPDWLKVGAWVRREGLTTGLIFRIVGFTSSGNQTFVQARFQEATDDVVIALEDVLRNCVPTTEPPKRLTAWDRLLGGLDEKE